MTVENLVPVITSSIGSFFIGVMLGYFLKKIVKIVIFVTGGIIALLLYLQQQQIISINLGNLEDSTSLLISSLASSFDKMTQIGDTASLGIPITSSLTAGVTIGFMRS